MVTQSATSFCVTRFRKFISYSRILNLAKLTIYLNTLTIEMQSSKRCSVKRVFLEISQNLQENTCARASFLIKLRASGTGTGVSKRLWHRCFPVNFVKFLRTPFFTEHLRWLLLTNFVEKISVLSVLRISRLGILE